MSFEGGMNHTPTPRSESGESSPAPHDVEKVLLGLNEMQTRLAVTAYHEHHPEVPEADIGRNDAMLEWVQTSAGAFRVLVESDPDFTNEVLEASDADALRAVLERIEGKSALH